MSPLALGALTLARRLEQLRWRGSGHGGVDLEVVGEQVHVVPASEDRSEDAAQRVEELAHATFIGRS